MLGSVLRRNLSPIASVGTSANSIGKGALLSRSAANYEACVHDSLTDIQHYLGAFAEETLEHGIVILLPYIEDVYLPLNAFTLGLAAR